MGDRLPIAFEAMAKAAQRAGMIAKDVAEKDLVGALSMAMQNSQVKTTNELISAFGEELRKITSKGLEQRLKSNTTAMKQFFAQVQFSGNEIFKSGFGDGLAELFRTLTVTLQDLQPALNIVGRVFGAVFRTISYLAKLMTNVLKPFTDILGELSEKIGGLASLLAGAAVGIALKRLVFMSSAMTSVAESAGTLGKVMSALGGSWLIKFLSPIAKAVALMQMFEELKNKLFDKDKYGLGYDPRLDPDSKHFDKKRYAAKMTESGVPADIANALQNYNNITNDPWSWLKQGVSLLQGSGLGGVMPKQEVIIHTHVNLDGKEVASSVTKTDEFKEGVTQTMMPTMMGGY